MDKGFPLFSMSSLESSSTSSNVHFIPLQFLEHLNFKEKTFELFHRHHRSHSWALRNAPLATSTSNEGQDTFLQVEDRWPLNTYNLSKWTEADAMSQTFGRCVCTYIRTVGTGQCVTALPIYAFLTSAFFNDISIFHVKKLIFSARVGFRWIG